MAGMTKEGLKILRQNEIVERMRQNAIPIFKDLVPPNEVLNTGSSSTLGRLIALNSVEYTDLWELALATYQAFDPNSASGVALENLVMYGALEREEATPTTLKMDLWVENGITLPADDLKFRSDEGLFYSNKSNVSVDSSFVRGIRLNVPIVEEGKSYGFTVRHLNVSQDVVEVATAEDTQDTILSKLLTKVRTLSDFNGSIEGRSLEVSLKVEDVKSVSMYPINSVFEMVLVRVDAACDTAGEVVQEAYTVSSIATPMLGVYEAINPFKGLTGSNTETDAQLRERFRVSKFIRASNIIESLYSALLDVSGMKYARVYENDTNEYIPEFNLERKSFRVVALGGSDEDVARAIWLNKPAGIEAFGNTMVVIKDSQGFDKEIHFDRPVNIPVYIELDIHVNTSKFPEDGELKIKQALLDYFSQEATINGEVVYSRLYTPINSVEGFQVNRLEIGTDPNNLGTNNIQIAFNEVASLTAEDIIITEV